MPQPDENPGMKTGVQHRNKVRSYWVAAGGSAAEFNLAVTDKGGIGTMTNADLIDACNELIRASV